MAPIHLLFLAIPSHFSPPLSRFLPSTFSPSPSLVFYFHFTPSFSLPSLLFHAFLLYIQFYSSPLTRFLHLLFSPCSLHILIYFPPFIASPNTRLSLFLPPSARPVPALYIPSPRPPLVTRAGFRTPPRPLMKEWPDR